MGNVDTQFPPCLQVEGWRGGDILGWWWRWATEGAGVSHRAVSSTAQIALEKRQIMSSPPIFVQIRMLGGRGRKEKEEEEEEEEEGGLKGTPPAEAFGSSFLERPTIGVNI